MTKEAMKLALEALKTSNEEWKSLADSNDAGYWKAEDQDHYQLTEKAIKALEEALNQDEDEPVAKLQVTLEDRPIDIELAQYKRMFEAACSALGEVGEALGCDPNEGGSEPLIAAIERLKSSSQEPIAWMVYTLDGKSVCVTDNPTDFTNKHRALPLYTTPQQRKPLTDEQILHIVSTHVGEISPNYPLDNSDWINFAHAIESAHGIKE